MAFHKETAVSADRRSFAWSKALKIALSFVFASSISLTTVAPAYAVGSSVAAPALGGLASAPAPGAEASNAVLYESESGETSEEQSASGEEMSLDGLEGEGLMSSLSTPQDGQTAKFEPPETPYNGAFTRSLPIEVPPFFELTPKLALNYNSLDNRQHSGDSFSILGVGWSLSGGGLFERKSLHGGVPAFSASDTIDFNGNALLECVVDGVTRSTPSCSSGGTHTARYETYERIKFNAPLNAWEVTARDGAVSVYRALGYFAPSSTADVRLRNDYRWLLQSITDTDGNTVTYGYDCAALPTCYVSSISYGASTVQFYWAVRQDSYTYATGISLAIVDKVMKSIVVKSGTSLVRAYALGHGSSSDTRRALLMGVTKYGSDATINSTTGVVSGGTSLPTDSFSYWDKDSRRQGTMISDRVTANTNAETQPNPNAIESPGPSSVPNNSDDAYFGDFNGDGRLDVIGVSNNNCTFFPALTGTLPYTSCSTGAYSPFDVLRVVADFNGDGKDDFGFVRQWSSTFPSGTVRTQLTQHGYGTNDHFLAVAYMNGFTIIGASVTPLGLPGDTDDGNPLPFLVGDFNGDGRADFFRRVMHISTGQDFAVSSWTNQAQGWAGDFNGDGLTDVAVSGNPAKLLISDGTGFQSITQTFALPGLHSTAIGDFNGDGASDVLANAGAGIEIFESQGNALVSAGTYVDGYAPTRTSAGQPYAADINASGKDVALYNFTISSSGGNSTNSSKALFRTATGFVVGCQGASATLSGDNNGDGKAEFTYQQSTDECDKPDSVVPDLLKQHTLSTGGTIDVEYLPSSYRANAFLPMILQTVTKVTTSDGQGNSTKTKYAYEGGAYDLFERRFLGFAKVTAELACEADENTCPWVHAWYRQEAVAAGSLIKLEVYSPDGKLRRKVENGHVVNQTSVPFSAFKTSEQVTNYLGANATDTSVTRTEWTYDGYANLLEEKALGSTASTVDDLITQTAYELNLSAYIVDRPNQVTAKNAAGAVLSDTQVYYDGASATGTAPTEGHATTTRKWLASESRWIAATAEFDSYGQPTAEVDPLGNRAERVYDSSHQFVIEERNPLWPTDARHKTLASWHALCPAPSTETDRNGLITSYTYDALCRQTRIDYPSGDYLTTAFFSLGNPDGQYVETKRSPADGTNPIWSKTYLDGLGRTYRAEGISATASSKQVVVNTFYTKRGEVRQTSLPFFKDSSKYYATTKYDVLSRPVLVTLPDNKTIATLYEAPLAAPGVQTVKSTDMLSRVKRITLDAAGHEIGRTGYIGSTASTETFAYDPLGNLVAITDPMGNAWSNAFDTLGRRTSSTDPDLGTWTYAYDDAGRLTGQIDAKSQLIAFTYDALGRLLTKTSATETVTSTYDQARSGYYNVGQLTTIANANASFASDYDNGGRLVRDQRTVGGTTYSATTTYDAGGRVTARTFPDGTSAGPYGYNAAGQQITLSGGITGTTYNAAGAVLTISYANGVATTYGYSPQREWLNTVSTVKSATTIQTATYTRDFAGRITGIDGNRTEDDWGYTYDNLDHLLSATNTNTPALSQTFTYDLGGKLLTNSAVGTYAYPTQGSSALQPHAVQAAGNWTFTYDLNGNQLNRYTSAVLDRALTYDNDNRPVTVTQGAATVSYIYGPDGERLKKTTSSGTTLYIADSERDPAGGWTTYPAPEVKRAGSVLNWLHRDHLSSVRRITDSAGAITRSSVYKPYGTQLETVVAALSPAEPKGWIGERTDPETGLTYLHARYYDAALGRFLSPDWWDPSDPGVGTDRYGYSLGDPINKSDPSGHVIDTAFDVLFIFGDAFFIVADEVTTGGQNRLENWTALGADVAGLLLPGLTGGGAAARTMMRGGGAIADASKVVSKIDGNTLWNKIRPTDRGVYIEQRLAATEYKDWFNVGTQPHDKYFRLVDFQKDNYLVSLKSVDTRGTRWFRDMEKHILDLANRGATVDGKPATMALDIRVQKGGVEDAEALVQIGRDNGVVVTIKEFYE